MPLFEEICKNDGCEQYGVIREEYFSRCTASPRVCSCCGEQRARLISRPAIIWTKAWGAYGNPSLERYNPDGITTYRKKSSRNADGSPEKVFLQTKAEVDSYCKAEGLIPPHELPSNAEVSSDGRELKSAGMRGCWI